MKSERVTSLLNGEGLPKFECCRKVDVPAEISDWKGAAGTRARALEIQDRNRAQLTKAFAEGQSVLGYERDGKGDGRFLLGAWNEGCRY